mmetsp:Transcript_8240/g.21929  ORF Transcript_8240/g.21929 Transcript_8240/m.21929 type:complete len:341 (+) Transcript_8240:609-1631(+)
MHEGQPQQGQASVAIGEAWGLAMAAKKATCIHDALRIQIPPDRRTGIDAEAVAVTAGAEWVSGSFRRGLLLRLREEAAKHVVRHSEGVALAAAGDVLTPPLRGVVPRLARMLHRGRHVEGVGAAVGDAPGPRLVERGPAWPTRLQRGVDHLERGHVRVHMDLREPGELSLVHDHGAKVADHAAQEFCHPVRVVLLGDGLVAVLVKRDRGGAVIAHVLLRGIHVRASVYLGEPLGAARLREVVGVPGGQRLEAPHVVLLAEVVHCGDDVLSEAEKAGLPLGARVPVGHLILEVEQPQEERRVPREAENLAHLVEASIRGLTVFGDEHGRRGKLQLVFVYQI